MNKSANVDISNLFRKFGGDTGNYQEIQQEYVTDKAQQSWPIVRAMEKAHAAEPALRTAAVVRRSPAPVARAGLNIAPSSTPLAKSLLHVATSDHQVAASLEGSLSAMLNKSVPAPVVEATPVRSLFGALTSVVKPVEVITQTHAKPVVNPIPSVQVLRSENDPLDSVFSRLLNPLNSAPAHSPEKSLRSMLGFLNK